MVLGEREKVNHLFCGFTTGVLYKLGACALNARVNARLSAIDPTATDGLRG